MAYSRALRAMRLSWKCLLGSAAATGTHEFRFGVCNLMTKVVRIPVRKHPGVFVVVDEYIWLEYLRLGFSPNISLDGNGGSYRYVRAMVWLPSPEARRSVAISLPRIFVAIYARITGKPLPHKGWTVRYQNSDRLDLSIGNLVAAPSKGQRNTFYASWTVHARMEITQTGGNPNAIFAAKRRTFRATHKAAIKGNLKAPVPPSPRPCKRRHRGEP